MNTDQCCITFVKKIEVKFLFINNNFKSSSSNGNIVDRIEISSSKQQVQTKDIVTGDPYIVSDKVVTLFTVNGEQYTRFRSLETGDVVYFPDSYQNYSTLIKQDNLISNNINKEI